MSDHIRELYDKDGNLIGCLLTAEAWQAAGAQIKQLLGVQEATPEKPEPMDEWEMLKEYWDFSYDPDVDVACDLCGNSTEDWQADEPRKFRLTSVTLGGLVSFRCEQCKARIQKKHFKDEIVTECTPYQENKKQRLEARY